MDNGVALLEPESMLKARAKGDNIEILIIWKDKQTNDSSWEEIGDFWKLYLDFQLEDELILHAGRDITIIKRPQGRP